MDLGRVQTTFLLDQWGIFLPRIWLRGLAKGIKFGGLVLLGTMFLLTFERILEETCSVQIFLVSYLKNRCLNEVLIYLQILCNS